MINELAFERLWIGTRNFHKRFRGDRIQRLDAAKRCMGEEGVEVLIENDPQALALELAHLMVTIIGVAISNNMSIDDFYKAMDAAKIENDNKNLGTHYLDLKSDDIRRRKPATMDS